MLNLKLQNMKEAAYFDYFKSFSLNASDTIKKLQTQFKQEIQQSFFFDPGMMFKRVKTLLGSYEILIYEINDSCEFVQIPEFGNCILKIFLQIMSVIRFLLHKILEKSSKKQDPSPLIDRTNSTQKNAMHMTHSHFPHSASLHDQNKLMYKKKQQSKYIIHNLNQQLSLLEMEQSQNLQASKKQFRSLIQGKQKLQSIEISQNQNILSQALNSFCKKGQHLKTFVNVRQAAMISNMKQGVGEYMKVKDILDEDSNAKLSSASVKLQELFKTHTINYLKEKQSEMVSQEIQAHFQEPLEHKILQENKHIKKLNQIVKKLNDQIGFEQQKAKSLENLLKTKNQEFQLKAMEFRVAKLEMQNTKIKNEKILQAQLSQINNSKFDICLNCQSKISSSSPKKKKSQVECTSKQIIESLDGNNNEQANQQSSQGKSDSVIQNASRLMEKMSRRAHYKNSSSLTRKNLASYKPVSSKGDELTIQSMIWFMKIQPQIIPPSRKQNSTKKRTIIQQQQSQQRVPSVQMNSTFSNYNRDQKRQKTRMLNSFQIQKVFTFCSSQLQNFYGFDTSESQLIGVKRLHKKNTEGSHSGSQTAMKQITEKWLDRDQVDQLNNGNEFGQEGVTKIHTFRQNDGEVDSGSNRGNSFDEQRNTSGSGEKDSQNINTNLLKKNSKSQQNLNKNENSHPQDEPLNSISRISVTHAKKFPKFIKFSGHQKITLTMKILCNLFFDIETSKNFEYINLFQNDDLRVGTAVQEKRKTNQALGANIKQLQKKNFINGLITRVKGEITGKNMSLSTTQTFEPLRANKQNVTIEGPSMNGTFSGTSMRPQFLNQLASDKNSQHQCITDQLAKFYYDSQNLVAMLFKQLRDLKRTSAPTSQQMTNYEMVRNFLRYPYSTITLQNEKNFLEKQRKQPGMEYLELRKIMQRIFKLHKNCRFHGEDNNLVDKVGMRQRTNNNELNLLFDENQNVLCWHLVEFFEKIGILLLPTKSQ